MFPDLEFIKTVLNGLRSRIEKVEDWFVSSRPNWAQNDPETLDYVKNRTHWDDESQTRTIDYDAWTGDRASIPLILGVWYEVSYSTNSGDFIQYVNSDDADGRFECKQNSVGELYVGYESDGPFCIYAERTVVNSYWLSSLGVTGLKLTGEITPGLHCLDKKYIPRYVLNEIHTLGNSVEQQNLALSGKMSADNPTGTGAFSLNRKADSVVGAKSFAAGNDTTASGSDSFAIGSGATASGSDSFAIGYNTTAPGSFSFAIGFGVTASGRNSFAIGSDTVASSPYSLAAGRYNVEDTSSRYVHIVGNGGSSGNRSNAYTLDWSGNAWFAGDVFVGGANQDDGVKLLKTGEAIQVPQTASVGQVLVVKAVDENGKPTEWEAVDPMIVGSSTPGSTKKFKISVDDSGTITATEV